MVSKQTASRGYRPARGLVRGLRALFSSVWLGIVLMALLFLYSTIVSAGLVYPAGVELFSPNGPLYLVPRIHWEYIQPRMVLDLTEMEAFSWWPFNLLLALFCVNLIVVTLRRIRLSLANLGVWMIHGGILVLVVGSVYYFSSKVEGDTPVIRRQVEICVPGQADLVRLPVLPDSQVAVGGYTFRVQGTDPNGSLHSGDDDGKTAFSVSVAVSSPTQSFVRQLLAGHPEYTEDVLPGQGRAVKATGKPRVDEALQMRLAYLQQDTFFVMDTGALYVRPEGAAEWYEYPLEGLPHYQDRIGDPSWVWQASGEEPLPIRPLDLPVIGQHAEHPLEGSDVRVTGYLRYAPEEVKHFTPGGGQLNPVVGLTLEGSEGESWDYDLDAFDPRNATAENGAVAFCWVESAVALSRLEGGGEALLHLEVPAQGVTGERRAPITVAAGPKDVGLHLFVDTAGSKGLHRRLTLGEPAEVIPNLTLRVRYLYPRATAETRPVVTPPHLRQKDAGAAFSRIRVEMRQGRWSRVLWLPYNAYALPDRSYAYAGRLAYLSRWVELPDGQRVELLFSRQRRPLGTQVALDTFELPTHTGGYTGQAVTVRDYISRVRFKNGDQWSDLHTIKNNHPAEHNGWWFFQATWDPPGAQGNGGMNYTGLGVGNRNGVYIQLVGTVIAVAGMLYAFYVKPILKRRRREQVKNGKLKKENGKGEPAALTLCRAESVLAAASEP